MEFYFRYLNEYLDVDRIVINAQSLEDAKERYKLMTKDLPFNSAATIQVEILELNPITYQLEPFLTGTEEIQRFLTGRKDSRTLDEFLEGYTLKDSRGLKEFVTSLIIDEAI